MASASCRLWIEAGSIALPGQARVLLVAPSELTQVMALSQITRVGLLSPGHLNGTGRWSLDPLAQLWQCQASLPNSKTSHGWIHVLEDGRELADCSGMDSVFEYQKTQLVYRADKQQVGVPVHPQ